MTPVVVDNHCNIDKLLNSLLTYFIFSQSLCTEMLLLRGFCQVMVSYGTLMSSIACLYPMEGVSDGIVVCYMNHGHVLSVRCYVFFVQLTVSTLVICCDYAEVYAQC